jgi:hypothetical protein
MKVIFALCIIACLSTNGYGQTQVFEKNLETARLNEKKTNELSKLATYQVTNGTISTELFYQISEVMAAKDGYIELIKISETELQLKHQSFLSDDDIQGVLNQFGVIFQRKKISDLSLK